MKFCRLFALIFIFFVAQSSAVVISQPSGLECEKIGICGLKARYKNAHGDTIHVDPTSVANFNPKFYTSKFSQTQADELGAYYVDDNINFDWNGLAIRQIDTRFAYPYKSKQDPQNAPFQMNPSEQNSWSAQWEGYIYIAKSGKYSFFVDYEGALAKINLNQKIYTTQDAVKNGNTPAQIIAPTTLSAGYHPIKINAGFKKNGAKLKLLWLYETSPDQTPGRALYENPQTKLEKMRIISRDSFVVSNPVFSANTFEGRPIYFRIINKEFFYANPFSDEVKNFQWKWNSPARAQYAKNNSYCVIAGTTDDENALPFKYNLSAPLVGIGKSYQQNIQSSSSSFRTSQITELVFSDKTSQKLQTLRAGECFGVDGNFINQRLAYAATLVKNDYNNLTSSEQQVANQEILKRIEKIFKARANGNMNDMFSVRPAGFALSFHEIKNGAKVGSPIESNATSQAEIENSLLRLHSGRNYELTIRAANFSDPKEGEFKLASHLSNEMDRNRWFYSIKNNTLRWQMNQKELDYTTKLTNLNIVLEGKNFNSNAANPELDDKICQIKTQAMPINNIADELLFAQQSAVVSKFSYDDVMLFLPHILDTRWTQVDAVQYKNFSSLSTSEQSRIKERIKNYGYECSGAEIEGAKPYANLPKSIASELENEIVACAITEVNPKRIEFMPDSFEFKYTLKGAQNHDKNEQFVYLNNINEIPEAKKSMLAKLNLIITPYNAKGEVVKNFTKACYAKDIQLVLANSSKDASNASLPSIIFDQNSTYSDDKISIITFDNASKASPNYKNSTLKSQKAGYIISKNAFMEIGNAGVEIGFNFERKAQPQEPFEVVESDFTVSGVSLDQNITSDQKFDIKTSQIYPKNQNGIVMLYARSYLPRYEGINPVILATEYYGFYCGKNCIDLSKFNTPNSPTPLKGEEMPSLSYWFVNNYHTDSHGAVYDYESLVDTIFAPREEIRNGLRTIEFKNQSGRENLQDSLKQRTLPWLGISSEYELPNIIITFHKDAPDWHGIAQNPPASGGGLTNGTSDAPQDIKFLDDARKLQQEISNRNNRRIEW